MVPVLPLSGQVGENESPPRPQNNILPVGPPDKQRVPAESQLQQKVVTLALLSGLKSQCRAMLWVLHAAHHPPTISEVLPGSWVSAPQVLLWGQASLGLGVPGAIAPGQRGRWEEQGRRCSRQSRSQLGPALCGKHSQLPPPGGHLSSLLVPASGHPAYPGEAGECWWGDRGAG